MPTPINSKLKFSRYRKFQWMQDSANRLQYTLTNSSISSLDVSVFVGLQIAVLTNTFRQKCQKISSVLHPGPTCSFWHILEKGFAPFITNTTSLLTAASPCSRPGHKSKEHTEYLCSSLLLLLSTPGLPARLSGWQEPLVCPGTAPPSTANRPQLRRSPPLAQCMLYFH